MQSIQSQKPPIKITRTCVTIQLKEQSLPLFSSSRCGSSRKGTLALSPKPEPACCCWLCCWKSSPPSCSWVPELLSSHPHGNRDCQSRHTPPACNHSHTGLQLFGATGMGGNSAAGSNLFLVAAVCLGHPPVVPEGCELSKAGATFRTHTHVRPSSPGTHFSCFGHLAKDTTAAERHARRSVYQTSP